MRYTDYFQYVRGRPDRAVIQEAWLARAIDVPDRREVQPDGRIRLWVYIPEAGKFLRVIVLADGQTVHNAFFDRRFRA
ncbi:MAG TPA: hypothetical protein PKE51_14110 [Gemmatimonadaceae bacterium]|jgi:hypothetical protein|nr:hypothetical protein [Gemmatimonadaceae bacterium]